MKPYYEHAGVTIYHGDCLEMDFLEMSVGAVVTDPPYGIGWLPPVNHRDEDHIWHDNTAFEPTKWLGVGRLHLFWGAQYFATSLPISDSWLTWVKRPIHVDFSGDARSYATTELAWCDFGCKSRFISHVWDGGKRAGNEQNRTFCHPAQKPVEVMSWCLSLLPKTFASIVLDPFAGSGTTLVAAKRFGYRAIGIEVQERYCEIAARRLAQDALPFEMVP